MDRSVLVSPAFGLVRLDFLAMGENHPCPYLPERQAREEFFAVDELPPELYHDFMDHGFRRSGIMFYRTACDPCHECRPIRVVVNEFAANKWQRRILRKNSDLNVRVAHPRYSSEKFKIYRDYLKFQHNRSLRDSSRQMKQWLYRSAVETLEFEYRLQGRLVAVSIADVCSRSLSSVYAYFDPEFADRSPGTFSAIHEIIFCQERGIPYYYLGFFVADCPAMNYKRRFKPHEILLETTGWLRNPAKREASGGPLHGGPRRSPQAGFDIPSSQS